MVCKQYVIALWDHILLANHSLNVPLLCFKNWLEDGSVNRNMLPSLW